MRMFRFSIVAALIAANLCFAQQSGTQNSSTSQSQSQQPSGEATDAAQANRQARKEGEANAQAAAAKAATEHAQTLAENPDERTAISKQLENAEKKLQSGMSKTPVYDSQFNDTTASNKILEWARFGDARGEIPIALQRTQRAQEKARAAAKASNEASRKLGGDASTGGFSASGQGTNFINDAVGNAQADSGALHFDEAIAEQQFSVLSLPNPLIVAWRSSQTAQGMPVWSANMFGAEKYTAKIFLFCRKCLLPPIALLAMMVLINKYLIHIYSTISRTTTQALGRQLILPSFLFVCSLLLISHGHSLLVSLRAACGDIAESSALAFRSDLQKGWMRADVSRYEEMFVIQGELDRGKALAKTNNADMTLTADERFLVAHNINATPDVVSRKNKYDDFCHLRLAYFQALYQDALSGTQGSAASIAAKDAFRKFLDDRQLLSPGGTGLAHGAVSATALNSTLGALDAADYFAGFGPSEIFFKFCFFAFKGLGVVIDFVICFCLDIAFCFIVVSAPLHFAAVDSFKEYAVPLKSIGFLLVFAVVSLLAHELAMAIYYESAASYDIAIAKTGKMTGFLIEAASNGTSPFTKGVFSCLLPADGDWSLKAIEAEYSRIQAEVASKAEGTKFKICIAGLIMCFGKTVGAYLVAKLVFPKTTLGEVSGMIYSGGSAIAGTVTGAVGAAAGAVMMFVPGGQVAGASLATKGASSAASSAKGMGGKK